MYSLSSTPQFVMRKMEAQVNDLSKTGPLLSVTESAWYQLESSSTYSPDIFIKFYFCPSFWKSNTMSA